MWHQEKTKEKKTFLGNFSVKKHRRKNIWEGILHEMARRFWHHGLAWRGCSQSLITGQKEEKTTDVLNEIKKKCWRKVIEMKWQWISREVKCSFVWHNWLNQMKPNQGLTHFQPGSNLSFPRNAGGLEHKKEAERRTSSCLSKWDKMHLRTCSQCRSLVWSRCGTLPSSDQPTSSVSRLWDDGNSISVGNFDASSQLENVWPAD